MHGHQLYGKLTFYLTTRNSGSMFENILSPNINVYGVSSAKPDEPTWESFCDKPDFPLCLSDEFAYAWFKDTEHHDPTKETLETQYEDLVKKVEGSAPQQYGAKDIANEVIGEFKGDSKSGQASILGWTKPQVTELVSIRGSPLHYWGRRLEMAKDNEVIKLNLNYQPLLKEDDSMTEQLEMLSMNFAELDSVQMLTMFCQNV
ncbi:hemoglobinase-like [Tetranychus urticae]|uniref:Uncharacterized protein n=1 Tax=Tetranychus urticae TaxID=32264 RepID=T1JRG0_TETUR|nr:hemoglobinase-like [Tetranychus urticae]